MAEEPLPAYGACCLGSINLSEFVIDPFTDKARFDFDNFEKAVRIGVRALNEVLDEGLPLHPLKAQQETARDWRQIGLGIMGLSDMLIKMKLTYGSPESLTLCGAIGRDMANMALFESALLAKKYGTYPNYNKGAILNSEFFIDNASEATKGVVEEYGLRNSQLLTCAPTGSIATMIGVSGGIEPVFANSYTRKTESLHGEDKYYKVFTRIAKQYMEENGLGDDESKLPSYFITAPEIPYEDRINMQSVWQKHIDASISSTVNLPKSSTVWDIGKLYMYAWEKGLKGITVYREGCKREGILTHDEPKETNTETKEKTNVTAVQSNELSRGYIFEVSDDLIGYKRKLQTGCGGLHFETYFDEFNGEPYETFINIGSSGSCERLLQALSRMMSLCLRSGVPVEAVIDQLKSIRPCLSYVSRTKTKGDTSPGTSCPSAIGNALEELYLKTQERFFSDMDGLDTYLEDEVTEIVETECGDCTICSNQGIEEDKTNNTSPKCPDCGEPLRMEGGCNICISCGWSKCD